MEKQCGLNSLQMRSCLYFQLFIHCPTYMHSKKKKTVKLLYHQINHSTYFPLIIFGAVNVIIIP